jgi:signal transduction histidine kinase
VRWGEVLLPVAALAVAAVTSALLREALESRIARRETGHLLQSVLAHLRGAEPAARPPQTAGARLAALRRLQQRVLSEDATRRALFEGMAEGVVLWGPDGTVVEANPAAARLWGGVPDQGELDPASIETIIRRGPRTLSVRTSDLEGGRLGLIRDITAERTLEERRREMQRLVSHELKTPLASITGFGETLERYALSGDELKRVASLIRGEAQRLHEMVTVFLDLERLGSGHWEGAAETLDLAPLVAKRIEILSAAAAARGLDIRSSLAAGCRVRGVPVLLERVVDNLVGNAIAYTSHGDTIEVELVERNGRATLVVRDHGPGIPREATAHIFDRFYRVPGRAGAGSGLGLALVKEVVSWHGGCIIVDSSEGIGSAFTVELPVAAEV